MAAGAVIRRSLLVGALALLTACATPPKPTPAPGQQAWSGRLGLNVDGRQPFSAGFELKGAPQAGELTLFTPLGGTAGVLVWAPGSATLRTSDGTREFPSLDALAQEVTGAPIPVAALFDWLAGKPTEVQGWTVDVSELAQGQLRARRAAPPPAAELRLVLSD